MPDSTCSQSKLSLTFRARVLRFFALVGLWTVAVAVSLSAAWVNRVPAGGGNTIYVTNQADRVTEYSTGATGNVAPGELVSGPETDLDQPAGVSADKAGNFYVTNNQSDRITIYSTDSNGDAAPSVTISGPLTQ